MSKNDFVKFFAGYWLVVWVSSDFFLQPLHHKGVGGRSKRIFHIVFHIEVSYRSFTELFRRVDSVGGSFDKMLHLEVCRNAELVGFLFDHAA